MSAMLKYLRRYRGKITGFMTREDGVLVVFVDNIDDEEIDKLNAELTAQFGRVEIKKSRIELMA